MSKRTVPNKLAAVAQRRGISVLSLIQETLKTEGSKLAASRKLGVAPNTIVHHLKKAHLTVENQNGVVIFREVRA